MSGTSDGQTSGRIITFYSYKGGTGRSMALANVACILARGLGDQSGQPDASNRRILAVDWDLEAPGLHRYFRPFLPEVDNASQDAYDREHPGLIDLFVELEKAVQGRSSQGPDEDALLIMSVLKDLDVENRFSVATSIGGLSFMKAGRFDDDYPSLVNNFRWDLLYERMPSLIPTVARFLSEHFSYVLIDSRTGITDSSGICTMLMPELLVLVFTPNLQSLAGVISLIHKAVSYRSESADLRPLVVFPLPSRIEAAKPALLEYWRKGSQETGFHGFQLEFESAFKESYGLEDCNLAGYFDEIQIQHVPDYAYGEQIAVEVEGTDSRLSLRRSYESFTRRLTELPSPWTDPSAAAAGKQIKELCMLGATALDRDNTQRAQRHFTRAFDVYAGIEALPVPELVEGLQRLGSKYLAEGELGEAETVLREAVEAAERSFGADDLRVADQFESLGDVLAAAGKAQEALEAITRALVLKKEALGQRHPSVADLEDKLGALLNSMGRLEESRVCFVQSLEARRDIFGPNDPALAASLERLADTATAMGSLREAEEYLNEALEIGARQGPSTRARILSRLGWLSLRKRDPGSAARYFEEAIKDLGPASGDPGTASIFDGLAQVAIASGDFEKAQSYYERAQLTRETVLGPSHPETLRSIVNLGDLAATQGKWERANTHYQRVISLVERTAGEAHPLAGEVYRKLGIAAQERGGYSEAESLYQHSIDIYGQLGDQAGISSGYRQLGTLAEVHGDYDSAESFYRRSLEIDERLGDQDGMSSGYHQLGMLAQVRQDYDSAESLFRRSLEIDERLGDPVGMLRSYRLLGRVAQDRGDYDSAESLYRRSLEIAEQLGDEASIATAYFRLGILAQDREEYNEAERLYHAALEINERLGDQDGMSSGYHQLGILAQVREDYDSAEFFYRRSLEIDERLGDQAGVAISYNSLAGLREELGDLDEAVAYRLRALTIRLSLGITPASEIQALARLHRSTGSHRFKAAALASNINVELVNQLIELFEQRESNTES